MATHPSLPKGTPNKNSKISLWRVFTPVGIILLLAIGSLHFLKSTLPPIGHTPIQSDKVNQLTHLSLTRLDGKTVKISELNAKIFLLNFWATWCEACIEEMPSIVALRESYKDQGFEVLGINVDENPSVMVPRAIKQLKMDFPIFMDPDGKLAELFDVHAIPLTVIINKKGEVLTVLDGGRNWNSAEIRQKLERWLNG
jgi:thiol-disulfide isomerase/thioredoxin